MSIDPDLGPSIQAFLVRDYRRCARLTRPLLDKNVTLDRAHLLLTSHVRLGEAEEADKIGLELLPSLTDPWEQALAALSIGRGDLDRLFDQAQTDQRRLQLVYHVGAFQVSRRMFKEARETFRRFLLSNMPPVACMELSLLSVENNYLTSGDSGSDLDKPVVELNGQAKQLFGQGDKARAGEVAERAYDLARQKLGELHPAYLTSLNNLALIRHTMGQSQEARPLFEKYTELIRLAAGPDDPAYAGALVNLAVSILKSRRMGEMLDFDRAESLLKQALEIQQKAPGESNAQAGETRELLDGIRKAREMATSLPTPPPPPEKKGAPQGFWARLFGRKPAAEDTVRATYGFTPEDPILCHQPLGEMQFLISLRCPNGHRLRGSRAGSLSGKCTAPAGHVSLFPGGDPGQSCVVDRYDSVCDAGEYSCTLYFDMYHPNLPPQPAPRGLSRVEST